MAAIKKHFKIKSRKILLAFFLLLCLFGITYVGIAFYYSRHFFPNTTINGSKVGNQTAVKAKEKLSGDIDAHNLTLIERDDKTEMIVAEEIEVKLDYGNLIEKALASQNYWKWPKRVFQKQKLQLEPELSYDEELLEKKISELEVMNQKDVISPKSARIVLKDNKFYIVRETKGTRIKKKTLTKKITEFIETSKAKLDLDAEDCYRNPKYSADDEKVRAALKTARAYSESSIIYEMEDTNEVLSSEEFNQWISVDSNMKVTIDKDKVASYVNSLAKKYDTVGNPIQFINHYGKTLTISGGTYGYEIDEDEEVSQLIEDIKSGKNVSRKPVYAHEPPSDTVSGYWSTYIEINIQEQHMWMVKDGQEIVSTSVVTGDVTEGNGTPTGAYYVFYKERNATLDGQGYSSPVDYWVAFNDNVGIHDASWRSEYGGTIYRGNGSHGCINTPYSNAKTIYENAELGTPVFVY